MTFKDTSELREMLLTRKNRLAEPQNALSNPVTMRLGPPSTVTQIKGASAKQILLQDHLRQCNVIVF